MNTQQLQKMRDKVEEKQSEEKLKQEAKQPPQSSTASPPSSSSSPSHEFSFAISLHPMATTVPADKNKASSSFAPDLSPADEIFFHGHLLPLHLLSNLPVSPRSSTNSLDSFTLPIKELLQDQNPNKSIANNNGDNKNHQSIDHEIKGRTKSMTFSLFGLSKWRKGCEVKEKEEKERHKRKQRFALSHVLKRYMRMVRPIVLFFRGRRGNIRYYHRRPYSFSGNLSLRPKQELRGRRGEFSAPASMWTSPTNSGLLLPKGQFPTTDTSDSTMEELQAAIQAAIAHCKNSIAREEKIKC